MFYVTCRGEDCYEDVSVSYDTIGEKVTCVCGDVYVVDYDEFYDSKTHEEECVWYLRTIEEWDT